MDTSHSFQLKILNPLALSIILKENEILIQSKDDFKDIPLLESKI